MKTTEKIVETYCRYVKQWFTISNIRCSGQYEIDLLAVDTTDKGKGLGRYHIECGVSISGSYSTLTANDPSSDMRTDLVQAAGQWRTVGDFIERTFDKAEVQEQLAVYGFMPGNHKRVIVTWGATDDATALALKKDVELWDFRDLLHQIADLQREHHSFFTDDMVRTIQLYSMAFNAPKSK